MGTRNGTDADAASVAKTFKNLGYKVQILNDQTVAEMKRLLLDGKKTLKLYLCIHKKLSILLQSTCELIVVKCCGCGNHQTAVVLMLL